MDTELITLLKQHNINRKNFTESEFNKVCLDMEKLLMNKYVITDIDRKYILEYNIYEIIKIMVSFSYPITQEEFNIYYNYLPLELTAHLKFDSNKFLFYIFTLGNYRGDYLKEHYKNLNIILENNREFIDVIDNQTNLKKKLKESSHLIHLPLLYNYLT